MKKFASYWRVELRLRSPGQPSHVHWEFVMPFDQIQVRAIRENWLLGTGYGTFDRVFPMYRDPACGIHGAWLRATRVRPPGRRVQDIERQGDRAGIGAGRALRERVAHPRDDTQR